MDIDHDKLKELYAGYVTSKRPRSREGCPSSAEIAMSFETSASARRKRKIIDHISNCSYCREEFMILMEYQKQFAESCAETVSTAPPRPEEPGPLKRTPRLVLWRYAGALFGLGIIVTSLVILRHQRDFSTALRSTQPRIILLAPKAGQYLSGSPIFRWRVPTPRDYYVLELFDQDLLPVWTSDKILGEQAQLPSAVITALLPGRRYFWMVTAFSQDSRVEESRLGSFVFGR